MCPLELGVGVRLLKLWGLKLREEGCSLKEREKGRSVGQIDRCFLQKASRMVTGQKPPQKAFNFPLLMRHATLPADKSQLPSRVACASLNNSLCVWKQRHRTKPFATPTYTTLLPGRRCPFSDICQVASADAPPYRNQDALSFNQWFSWRRANTISPLPTTAVTGQLIQFCGGACANRERLRRRSVPTVN